MYTTVKVVSMTMAIRDGGYWQEVLVSSWTSDDMAMLMLVLSFWFVGRVYERK